MTRRGRPAADRLDLVERIVRLLADDPTLSANDVCRAVQARRRDVLRAVAALRAAESLADLRMGHRQGRLGSSRPTRFPFGGEGP